MKLRNNLAASALQARGLARVLAAQLTGDLLLAFRGQQDLLCAKLARRGPEDSYLGPGYRPPMRRVAHTPRLQLVALA
jgi:hypothetical protein